MNLVFLVGKNLDDFALHDWVDCRAHRVHVYADGERSGQRTRDELVRAGAQVRMEADFGANGGIEAQILALHARIGIDRVLGLSEQDVRRAALLREALGLPGQSVESATAYRDKVVMKTWLRAAGIPVAAFRALASPLDLLLFVREHGLPVYLKPRSSCSGIGGQAITDDAGLAEALRSRFAPRIARAEYAGDLMVEAFVHGALYHVDGVVLDGEVLAMVPSRYLAPALPMSSATLDPDDPLTEPLVLLTKAVLKALPPAPAFSFHAEVFQTPAGGLLVNEIAARTGGGKIDSVVRLVTGVAIGRTAVLGQISVEDARAAARSPAPQHPAAGFTLSKPLPGSVTPGSLVRTGGSHREVVAALRLTQHG